MRDPSHVAHGKVLSHRPVRVNGVENKTGQLATLDLNDVITVLKVQEKL